MIRLDPPEMIAASETLRSCAIEAADIGSQLLGCACCPMPAAFQSVVDELVTVADRALDAVAAELGISSADLNNRAQIAATDSLAAASSAVDTNTSPNTNVSSGPLVVSIVLDGQAYAQVDGVLVAVNPGLTTSIIGGGPLGLETVAPGTLTTSIIGGESGSLGIVAPGTTGTSFIGGESGILGTVAPGPMGMSIMGGAGTWVNPEAGRGDRLPGDTGFMFGAPPGMVDPPWMTTVMNNLPMQPHAIGVGGLINPLVGGPSDTPAAVSVQSIDRAVGAGYMGPLSDDGGYF